MNGGVGNLVGYLGVGWYFDVCTVGSVTHWTFFWGGMSTIALGVLIYFLITYEGTAKRLTAAEH
jgi:hypothetical protein